MKRAKKCSFAVLFVVSVIMSLATLTSTASATSDYDNLLHTSSSLNLYTDGSVKSKKMDVSGSWWGEFKQTYAKRVLQGIGWPTDFVTKFEEIVDSDGSYGIYMQETTDGVFNKHRRDA